MAKILLMIILLLVSSLVVYWLAWSWQSALLLLAFFYSLKDILLASTVRIDVHGVTLSHPLSGATHVDWEDLAPLQLKAGQVLVQDKTKLVKTVGAPGADDLPLLVNWQEWQARGEFLDVER